MNRFFLDRFPVPEHRTLAAGLCLEAVKDGCRTPVAIWDYIRARAESLLADATTPDLIREGLRQLLPALGAADAWNFADYLLRREALPADQRGQRYELARNRAEAREQQINSALPPTAEQLRQLEALHYIGKPPKSKWEATTRLRKAQRAQAQRRRSR